MEYNASVFCCSERPDQFFSQRKKRSLLLPGFTILNTYVASGTSQKINLVDPIRPETPMVITVINGRQPGPTLCVTAAVHGNELNGIEVVRRFIEGINPEELCGVIIGIPIVNVDGFNKKDRYLDVNCDLNRCFAFEAEPQHSNLLAQSLFQEVITHSDAVIDIHTGSSRNNYPQVRADLSLNRVEKLSGGVGDLAVVQSRAPIGSLREAASSALVPTIVMEIGISDVLEQDKIDRALDALREVVLSNGMTKAPFVIQRAQTVFLGGGWVRADNAGFFIATVKPGDVVGPESLLGHISDPNGGEIIEIRSPFACTILAQVNNKLIKEGCTLFQVGI